MTNKEREAIEICKEKIIEPFYDFPNPTSIELKDTDVEAIDTVLSLIKEQQEEISKYKTLYERALSDVVKKDKMIDLMAKTISNNIVITYFNDAENVKRYYEKLVKTKSEQL